MTISVGAQELRRCLTAVLPHAGTDDTLPSLVAVRLEARGGWLYLAATDRYSLAIARLRIPGDEHVEEAALLPLKAAKALRRLLKRSSGAAAITITDGKLGADAGDGMSGSWEIYDGAFPAWAPMARKMLAADPAELGQHGVDPALLARVTRYEDPLRAEPLRMRFTAGGNASGAMPVVVVGRGDWFTGFLMPARVRGDEPGPAPWGEWAAATATSAEAVSADA